MKNVCPVPPFGAPAKNACYSLMVPVAETGKKVVMVFFSGVGQYFAIVSGTEISDR